MDQYGGVLIYSGFAGKKKKSQKIVALTAYDFLTARLWTIGVDLILVGIRWEWWCMDTRLPVMSPTEDSPPYPCGVSGRQNALLISDMPFGSYHGNPSESLNAIDLVKQVHGGVKVEEQPLSVGINPQELEAGSL